MRTFERRDQRRERLLAADAARSFDGGPCDPVVGLEVTAPVITALRHGAAVTQPCEHRGPGFGVISAACGGNPRKDPRRPCRASAKRHSGIRQVPSLTAANVRYRLSVPSASASTARAAPRTYWRSHLSRPLAAFTAGWASRGHEVRKQAQIGIGSAGVIPAVTGPGSCGGQRFERSARTADGQRIVNLFGRRRRRCRAIPAGGVRPASSAFGESIGQRAFPFGRKGPPLRASAKQNWLGAGRRDQRTDRIVGQIGVVQTKAVSMWRPPPRSRAAAARRGKRGWRCRRSVRSPEPVPLRTSAHRASFPGRSHRQ